jgi:rRNA pseudouridine-1189 N-methylase Emg1 (Nep1/Mra1 family)
METIVIKPRNKDEFDLVSKLLKKMQIRTSVFKQEETKIRKSKAEFLDSLPKRLNQVKLHEEGKLKLKDAKDLLNEL